MIVTDSSLQILHFLLQIDRDFKKLAAKNVQPRTMYRGVSVYELQNGANALFLASKRSLYVLSPVRLLSVCRLSVTLVRPTQPVEIFRNFLCHLVPWPSVDIHGKFYGDRPRGTPPSGELNTRGVARYRDF